MASELAGATCSGSEPGTQFPQVWAPLTPGRVRGSALNQIPPLCSKELGRDKFNCRDRNHSLKVSDNDIRTKLTATNMLAIQVQNKKIRRDGSYENTTLTHNDLFAHYKLEMDAVLSIPSLNMSTTIHNNLFKYIQFKDNNYDSDFLVGNRPSRTTLCQSEDVTPNPNSSPSSQFLPMSQMRN